MWALGLGVFYKVIGPKKHVAGDELSLFALKVSVFFAIFF